MASNFYRFHSMLFHGIEIYFFLFVFEHVFQLSDRTRQEKNHLSKLRQRNYTPSPIALRFTLRSLISVDLTQVFGMCPSLNFRLVVIFFFFPISYQTSYKRMQFLCRIQGLLSVCFVLRPF